jgi:hypothetical protein
VDVEQRLLVEVVVVVVVIVDVQARRRQRPQQLVLPESGANVLKRFFHLSLPLPQNKLERLFLASFFKVV